MAVNCSAPSSQAYKMYWVRMLINNAWLDLVQ